MNLTTPAFGRYFESLYDQDEFDEVDEDFEVDEELPEYGPRDRQHRNISEPSGPGTGDGLYGQRNLGLLLQ